MLPSHGRYEHSAIPTRPVYRWPNGAKLAVYFSLGIEHYAFGDGVGEELVTGLPQPDVLNASWREYGNRVASWRMLDAFKDYQIPLSILLNTAVYEEAPDLMQACREAGHEIVAHGYTNSEHMGAMTEAAEAGYIARVTRQIETAEGTPPTGWTSPWIIETPHTPDLLAEAGYSYLLDWVMDDQPVWMATRKGRILSVPYSQELNDSAAIIGRRTTARDFADMIIDQFDEMMAAKGDEPLVMSVILHSFISGQPFRLRALRKAIEHIVARRDRIWLTQPGKIASHAAEMLG